MIAGNYIMPDYYKMGYNGAIQLIIAGYRRFFYAGLAADGPHGKLMERGFHEALEEHGFSDGKRQYLSEGIEMSNFYQLWRDDFAVTFEIDAEEFIDHIKDQKNVGIFCSSLSRSERLVPFLKEKGLSIPDDIGVISANIQENNEKNETLDQLFISRLDIFQEAVNRAMQPDFRGIQKLIKPQIIKGETLRRY